MGDIDKDRIINMEDGHNICKCQCQYQAPVQEVDKSRSEVALVWWDFLQETTFHGCRNIEDRRRSVVYRILWTLIVLGMLVALLYTLLQSYYGYYEYRVNSKNRLEIYQEMPFPAVTVCSAASFNVARKNMSQTLRDYIGLGTLYSFLIPPINWSDPAVRELEQMTIEELADEFSVSEVSEFIKQEIWSGEGDMKFKPVKTLKGTCFLANSTGNITQKAVATEEGRTGGLAMILNIQKDGTILQGDMTYGAMVFVHDPNENARTLESGVMVAPGFSSYINLKPTRYKFLPAPYKSYGELYCVETGDSYSYEACASDWSATQTALLCNCTSGLEPPAIKARFPSCSLKQYAFCSFRQHVYFLQQTLKANFTECPKPCAFTRYETSLSFSKFPTDEAAEMMVLTSQRYGPYPVDLDYVKKNILKVTIYYEKFFMENIEYEPAVTINSILSSLGGQMGFFLGASLVTVAEFGETILRSFWTLMKKMSGAGNKVRVVSPPETQASGKYK